MKLENDSRPIQLVVTPGEGGSFWRVGHKGITKIETYFENGQMALIPWIAVYEGDSVKFRINCASVEYIAY